MLLLVHPSPSFVSIGMASLLLSIIDEEDNEADDDDEFVSFIVTKLKLVVTLLVSEAKLM